MSKVFIIIKYITYLSMCLAGQ